MAGALTYIFLARELAFLIGREFTEPLRKHSATPLRILSQDSNRSSGSNLFKNTASQSDSIPITHPFDYSLHVGWSYRPSDCCISSKGMTSATSSVRCNI